MYFSEIINTSMDATRHFPVRPSLAAEGTRIAEESFTYGGHQSIPGERDGRSPRMPRKD
jgi:hypothetical protein